MRMIFWTHVSVLMTLLPFCVFAQQPCRSFETASDNLREIIIGSCSNYQQNVNQPVFCKEGFRNCTEIWEAFSEAFLYQPLCNVDDSRYDRYINLTDHTIPTDKSLFWENVYPFVMRYANQGKRFTALSDTLPGYIANGPQWCSAPNELSGMSKPGTICPGWGVSETCPQSAQRAFWIAASKNFGRKSSGEIFILLNATFDPIFANDTINAVYELPYLRENVVTKATVLLINESPVQGKSKCDDPSLDIIREKLKPNRIEYACMENRRDVVETYCLDNPVANVCKVMNDSTNTSPRTRAISLTLMLISVILYSLID